MSERDLAWSYLFPSGAICLSQQRTYVRSFRDTAVGAKLKFVKSPQTNVREVA